MIVAWVLNALALAFGAALGARALIDPAWAQRFVRLKPDEQGGGEAEFRARFGGVFFFSHAAALYLTLIWLTVGGEYVLGVAASGAAFVLAAAWAGACFGRLIAMWRDGVRTKFNAYCAGAEAGLAFCIGAPWALWVLG